MKGLDVVAKLQALECAVQAMHEASDRAGCAFYGQDDWLAAYDKTRDLVAPGARVLVVNQEELDALHLGLQELQEAGYIDGPPARTSYRLMARLKALSR